MNTALFHRRLIHVVVIIVLAFLAYANTFSVPFVLDDNEHIIENTLIRDLGNFSVSELVGDKRSVAMLSFAGNYAVHGFSVGGYHLVNLLIHMGNGLLIYAFVLLSFQTPALEGSSLRRRERWIALFGALLFVSHPLQTQAVTYIVQRMASLATLFFLLSLVLYIRSRLVTRRAETVALYVLSVVSAVLAMKTKEIAFTLPVMVALYEVLFFRGKWTNRLLLLLPLMLTMLIIPLSIMNIDMSVDKPIDDLIGEVSDATQTPSVLGRWEYMATQSRVLMTYLRLVVLPVNQNLDYDYPVFRSFGEPAVLVSFGVLALPWCFSIYLAVRSRKGARAPGLIAYGIFWFFVTLSVESSVIPITDVIFEHRMYLPMVGVVIGISTAVCIVIEALGRRKSQAKWASVALLAVIIFVLTGTTFARNAVWGDKVTLWTDAVKKSPDKMRTHYCLANAYMEQGLVEEAIVEYTSALRDVWPDYHQAHYNLGNAYESLGMITQAIKHYRAAIAIVPDFPPALNNLGNTYASQGNIDDAIRMYQKAIAFDPGYAEAHGNLGNVYAMKGLYDEAIQAYERALRLNPDYEDARYNLSVVRRMRDRR